MATHALAAFFSFRDSQGRTARTDLYIEADDTVPDDFTNRLGNLVTPFVNTTNAALQNRTGNIPQEVDYGTNAQYASAQDKMVLQFQDTNGAKHRIQVPAPKLACFASDGLTVVNSGVAGALITAIIANCVSRDNLSLLYLSGWFARRRNQRRTSSLVLTPAGTGQAVP